ncbi:MAG: proteasome beta subunit [Verrucomicrobiales bacterium]|jgi:proteasome beta subunit
MIPTDSPIQPRAMNGDFLQLLPENPLAGVNLNASSERHHVDATTVFAFHYRDGVIMVGDHRATAGNIVFTDKVEKIVDVDEASLMAIAGSPAVAFEMTRTLQTSFEFYRRSQLQRMSLRARTRALSQLLRNNMPAALQGIGLVVPVFAGIDLQLPTPAPVIFFYDPLGAQFEATDFAASGSGSPSIRSALSYLEQWGSPKPRELDLEAAIVLANRLLITAAEIDTATGGVDPGLGRFATVKTLTTEGISTISDDQQAEFWTKGL